MVVMMAAVPQRRRSGCWSGAVRLEVWAEQRSGTHRRRRGDDGGGEVDVGGMVRRREGVGAAGKAREGGGWVMVR